MQHAQHAMLTTVARNMLSTEFYALYYYTNDAGYIDMMDGHFPNIGTCKAESECSAEYYNGLCDALEDVLYSITGIKQDNEYTDTELKTLLAQHIGKVPYVRSSVLVKE